MKAIRKELEDRAKLEGFDAFGVSSIDVELRRDYYRKWIEDGKHGEMAYLARDLNRRLNPENILDEARSVIFVGLNYYQPQPEREGVIATYALGKDYHKIIFKKLKRLCLFLKEHGGIQRPYVDTGPLLEKPLAQAAGLGWQGKSTLLIHKKLGTWLFLGAIVTTLDLEPSKSAEKSYCGGCTACIDVCPTRAITAPYQLDARKCIAYLTIEYKGAIEESYRPLIGDKLFGCDDCLTVCPWNRWAKQTSELRFAYRDLPDLREMLYWSEETFNTRFEGTPIRRLKRDRWFRNVCVVLGNIGKKEDLSALSYVSDTECDMVAQHASWAIAQIESRI